MIYTIGSTGKSNPSTVLVRVNHDGKAFLYIGTGDIGQGSNTAMAQIAAETLGISIDDIAVVYHDTEYTPYDYGTGASRVTFICGNATKIAAQEARAILLDTAARMLSTEVDALTIRKGEIFITDLPSKKVSVAEAAFHSERVRGKPVYGLGSYTPNTGGIDKETGQGRPYARHVFATQVADVEVDTLTGEVSILRIVAVHDCGKVINPLLAQGQVEGGIAMGIGHALMEEIKIDEESGRVLNDTLTDYFIPTIKDVPQKIEVDFVENKPDFFIHGTKGIGEPANLPTVPAIINAIYDAIGVWITDLPATPEKILLALNEKNSHKE